jgi:hypothetical protein
VTTAVPQTAQSSRSKPRFWFELRRHVPFTLLRTGTGVMIAGVLIAIHLSSGWTAGLFWGLHPLHVLLSAMATTSLYRHWARAGCLRCFIVGYIGAVGIATLSDCVIPYIGEWMLDLPNRGWHIGFIEKWWLINPAAIVGIAIAWLLPNSTIPHAGHVLLSTWASLFHIQLALGSEINLLAVLVLPAFVLLAVWLPCCSSDIVLPVLFPRKACRYDYHPRSRESERAV